MKKALLLSCFVALSSLGAHASNCDTTYVCTVSGTLMSPVQPYTNYTYASEPRCTERDAKLSLIRIIRKEQMRKGLRYDQLLQDNVGWFDSDYAKTYFPSHCEAQQQQPPTPYCEDGYYVCQVSGTLLSPAQPYTSYTYESEPRCGERAAKLNLIRVVRKAQVRAGLSYDQLLQDNVGWFDSDYAKHYFPSSCSPVK